MCELSLDPSANVPWQVVWRLDRQLQNVAVFVERHLDFKFEVPDLPATFVRSEGRFEHPQWAPSLGFLRPQFTPDHSIYLIQGQPGSGTGGQKRRDTGARCRSGLRTHWQHAAGHKITHQHHLSFNALSVLEIDCYVATIEKVQE